MIIILVLSLHCLATALIMFLYRLFIDKLANIDTAWSLFIIGWILLAIAQLFMVW